MSTILEDMVSMCRQLHECQQDCARVLTALGYSPGYNGAAFHHQQERLLQIEEEARLRNVQARHETESI